MLRERKLGYNRRLKLIIGLLKYSMTELKIIEYAFVKRTRYELLLLTYYKRLRTSVIWSFLLVGYYLVETPKWRNEQTTSYERSGTSSTRYFMVGCFATRSTVPSEQEETASYYKRTTNCSRTSSTRNFMVVVLLCDPHCHLTQRTTNVWPSPSPLKVHIEKKCEVGTPESIAVHLQ